MQTTLSIDFAVAEQTQIATLMEKGQSENPNISVYELLSRYQREREKFVELDMALLWDRIKDDQSEPLSFYVPSDIYLSRLDKKRDMQLQTLLTIISRDLKNHRMFAEERLWTAYQSSRAESDDQLYPDGVTKALQFRTIFISCDFGHV